MNEGVHMCVLGRGDAENRRTERGIGSVYLPVYGYNLPVCACVQACVFVSICVYVHMQWYMCSVLICQLL